MRVLERERKQKKGKDDDGGNTCGTVEMSDVRDLAITVLETA